MQILPPTSDLLLNGQKLRHCTDDDLREALRDPKSISPDLAAAIRAELRLNRRISAVMLSLVGELAFAVICLAIYLITDFGIHDTLEIFGGVTLAFVIWVAGKFSMTDEELEHPTSAN